MDRQLGQDLIPALREQFLKDNCDACEQKGYMRQYTPEELSGHKESLPTFRLKSAK